MPSLRCLRKQDAAPERFDGFWDPASPELLWTLRHKSKRDEFITACLKVEIGRWVRGLRVARSWSQTSLARNAGLIAAQVSGIENATWRCWPSLRTLVRIAQGLDCGIEFRFVPISRLVESRVADGVRRPEEWFVPDYITEKESLEAGGIVEGDIAELAEKEEEEDRASGQLDRLGRGTVTERALRLRDEAAATERQYRAWKLRQDERKREGMV